MLSAGEVDELARDIEKIGHLRSPLSLWRAMPEAEWQLLDGRNRCAALARLSGGEERIKGAVGCANLYEADTDPLAFVVSANILRRQLTAQRRAS
jgi:hypothetical protein